MRILHLDGGSELRGGQWQVLRLVEGLGAEGISSTLLCRGALLEEARKRGLDARPLGWWRIAALARQSDLLHAHDARSHTMALLAAAGRPLVVARRVAFPVRSPWKYRRAARYIAVSRYVEGVLAEGGVARERIEVVYDGVPELPEAAGPRQGVLAAALADPLKGRGLIRQAAASAGIEVRFSSHLEADLPAFALFVYITESEGLGSAVLLAMAASTPVIASRVGGLPEVVEDGVTGLLVENSPEAIAAAIRRLLGDSALAVAMAARARRTAAERFSVASMVRGTIDVYRKVLAC